MSEYFLAFRILLFSLESITFAVLRMQFYLIYYLNIQPAIFLVIIFNILCVFQHFRVVLITLQ